MSTPSHRKTGLLRSRAMKVSLAAAGSLGLVAAGTAAYAGVHNTPGTTVFHGCVMTAKSTPSRVIFDVFTGSTPACPKGSFAVSWNQAGPAGPKGATGPAGPQGPAGPPAGTSITASTAFSSWPESSGWADDNFSRTLSLTLQHAAPSARCGGTPVCFFYTGVLTDTGSFTTVDGKPSPNGSSQATVHGVNTGTLNGTADMEFYASSAKIAAANVPATATGAQKSATFNTTDWAEQAFPAGTTFASVSLTAYDWQYALAGTCEAWNDQINPGDDGQGAADGDITGVSHC